jgi:hypothetical protein
MFRAVAVDIDGTLTDEKRRLHLEAVRKVREIEERGIPVILATGNILCFAEAAYVFIGTSGPIIAENGGIVADLAKGKIKYMGDIKKVREAFQSLSKKVAVRKVQRSDLRRTEIAIYRDVDVDQVREALKDYNVSIVDTKFAIHIKDPSVNKGRALAEVTKIMGIKLSEVIAIGDSENDREMLELAGYSISVGEESLRDVSDYVTRATFGDGGKEALEHCLKMMNIPT